MRTNKISFFLLLLVLFAATQSFAGNVEQTVVRMLSYDPHPASAAFSEKAPFNGEMTDLEVTFQESWKEIKDYAVLNQVSFSLRALKNGQPAGEVSGKKIALDKVKKGQLLDTISLGDLTLSIITDEIQKKGNGITDITLTFKVSYPEATLQQAQEKQAENQAPMSLTLARKLAEKAESMPDSNPKAKAALFKRALTAAPLPDVSSESAEFHQKINEKIQALEAQLPVQPSKETNETKEIEKKIEKSEPSTVSVDKSVNAEAKELLKNAKAFFAQEKGPEGREALRKALEIAPDFHEALIVLGDNNYSNRKYARAKEAFDKALNLLERDSETLMKYFKACYYLGEGADAIVRLENANRKFTGDRRIKLALAEAYFQLGDLTSAQAVCSDLLTSDPSNMNAKDLMDRINRLMK